MSKKPLSQATEFRGDGIENDRLQNFGNYSASPLDQHDIESLSDLSDPDVVSTTLGLVDPCCISPPDVDCMGVAREVAMEAR